MRKSKAEAKLAVVGFVLSFLTFCCGIFCGILVIIDMGWETQLSMIGWNNVHRGRYYKDYEDSDIQNSFLTLDKPRVPISSTSSEPATYAILHLGANLPRRVHAPLGRVEMGKPLGLPGLSQWPIKGATREY